FNGDLLLTKNVQFSLGIGLLVNLSTLCRWCNRIKDSPFGDSRFNMLGHKGIAIAGDSNTGILWSHRRIWHISAFRRRGTDRRNLHKEYKSLPSLPLANQGIFGLAEGFLMPFRGGWLTRRTDKRST